MAKHMDVILKSLNRYIGNHLICVSRKKNLHFGSELTKSLVRLLGAVIFRSRVKA